LGKRGILNFIPLFGIWWVIGGSPTKKGVRDYDYLLIGLVVFSQVYLGFGIGFPQKF